MEYQLALPPDLGLSPADFVAAWNASAECCTIAQASLSSSTSAQYDPLLVAALALLSTVGIGVATNALYDLIKQVLITKGVHTQTQIVKIDQPDGTRILVVTIDEQ